MLSRAAKVVWAGGGAVTAGRTVYSLNDAGLIQTQAQTWSVSAANALWQTFTPS